MEITRFINEKYKKTPDKELETLDSSITPFEIKMFYQRCNTKLERILFSALNNLKNRKLIMYELQTVVTYKNRNGEIESFIADDNDKKKILEMERYVLKKELKLENMFQLNRCFYCLYFYHCITHFICYLFDSFVVSSDGGLYGSFTKLG